MSDITEEYRHALRRVILVGGDQSDIQLAKPAGPNDAVHRGLMYISARNIALQALQVRLTGFYRLWEEFGKPEETPTVLYAVVASGRVGGNQRLTHVGDFTKAECYAFAQRLNAGRMSHSSDKFHGVTYRVMEYHCVEVSL